MREFGSSAIYDDLDAISKVPSAFESLMNSDTILEQAYL
jgi:hypothetical protein